VNKGLPEIHNVFYFAFFCLGQRIGFNKYLRKTPMAEDQGEHKKAAKNLDIPGPQGYKHLINFLLLFDNIVPKSLKKQAWLAKMAFIV